MKKETPERARLEDHPVAAAIFAAMVILGMPFSEKVAIFAFLVIVGGLAFWVLARVLADIAAIFGGGDR